VISKVFIRGRRYLKQDDNFPKSLEAQQNEVMIRQSKNVAFKAGLMRYRYRCFGGQLLSLWYALTSADWSVEHTEQWGWNNNAELYGSSNEKDFFSRLVSNYQTQFNEKPPPIKNNFLI